MQGDVKRGNRAAARALSTGSGTAPCPRAPRHWTDHRAHSSGSSVPKEACDRAGRFLSTCCQLAASLGSGREAFGWAGIKPGPVRSCWCSAGSPGTATALLTFLDALHFREEPPAALLIGDFEEPLRRLVPLYPDLTACFGHTHACRVRAGCTAAVARLSGDPLSSATRATVPPLRRWQPAPQPAPPRSESPPPCRAVTPSLGLGKPLPAATSQSRALSADRELYPGGRQSWRADSLLPARGTHSVASAHTPGQEVRTRV